MSPEPRRLLVTGATGFLGAAVVDMAKAEGWRVRALSRKPSRTEGVEVVAGDIRDTQTIWSAFEGMDAVVHAAGLAHVFGSRARNSAEFHSVNEVGTLNVIDAAVRSHVPQVVLVSSVSVYGSYSDPKCDETAPCNPVGPYATSKYKAELGAIERMANRETSMTILRFATIYGKGDRGNVAKLIGALDRGRFIWLGSGNNRKSLIHRTDAARACLLPLQRRQAGTEIFNVSAQTPQMREIVTLVCHALGRPVPRWGVPEGLIKVLASAAKAFGDPGGFERQISKFMREDVYDGALFERKFGFSPQVSLADGVREEVLNLRNQAGF